MKTTYQPTGGETQPPQFLLVTPEQLEGLAQAAADKALQAVAAAQDNQMYTRKQAAELLGVDYTTIWRWEQAGLITPEISPSGKARFTRAQLLQAKGGNV